jgi:RHS repeat-associated protein
VVGRLTADAITTLGAGVDGAVRRLEVGYDGRGNPYLFTSYSAATSGSILNQVQREYNSLGQLITEYQEHSGAVNTETTPSVQYAYSEMADEANHSRLVSMTYPDGRVLEYNYASGLDDNISRLTSLSDNSGTLESYDYLGLGGVVRRAHPQPDVDLTYIKQSGENDGDAGDQYIGLDRFGRVVDQRWLDTSTDDDVDRFQYGYDANSNRLYRENVLDVVFSELYQYDDLNQLIGFDRGELNSTKDGIEGTATRSQEWDLDAVGNWMELTTGITPEARVHNRQNQVTEVGSATLTFDANGNLTTDQTGRQFVYDAWNRLVEVLDDEDEPLAAYQYDGLGRRIVETVDEEDRDFYYSSSWQLLEERVPGEGGGGGGGDGFTASGTQTAVQYVWSPVYVDAMILRDRDTDANGSLDERVYVLHDANFNVTALVDTDGDVVERYVYDPYGAATVYDVDWTAPQSSGYDWKYLHQGGRYEEATDLYIFRHRDYSPTLGRWLENDPVRFGGFDINLYNYVHASPALFLDPMGLWTWRGCGGWAVAGGVFGGPPGAGVGCVLGGLFGTPRNPEVDPPGHGAVVLRPGGGGGELGFLIRPGARPVIPGPGGGAPPAAPPAGPGFWTGFGRGCAGVLGGVIIHDLTLYAWDLIEDAVTGGGGVGGGGNAPQRTQCCAYRCTNRTTGVSFVHTVTQTSDGNCHSLLWAGHTCTFIGVTPGPCPSRN